MKCPACQFENPGDAQFCIQCGHSIEFRCPGCGAITPASGKFCKACGYDLSLPLDASLKELSFDEKLEKIQKYLPGGLTEKILAQRGKIEGERKQVTVLFCDMEGFTPLVERLGPENAYSIMDQVYEILIHKVHEFEGTVNEMTGDGVLALFGAPIAIENAPQRAIQSALAIHRELARFNDQKKREGLTLPVRMRIGIHSGPVVVGTLGNDLRVEFKAVGDTVILASRLEDLAEPGTTFVSEETFKLAEGLFRFEALGGRAIKGKGEPVKVYRVIAPSTRSTRFEVSAERGLTPFVGRERELELLLDGFERIKAGRGQAFSVVAEAGVGKTRLLYELRKAIAHEDVTIREGRCISYGQSEAYRPIAEILKSNFDIYEQDEDSIVKEKVRSGLKAIQADETSTLPYLLELFSVGESGINKALSADERKYQFLEALRRVALKGSEVRPLVMAIEDLHWIDKGSEEVLKGLFESIAGSRILLIFTYRPEFVHTWGTKSYHNHITLNRLSNRETLMMASHLLDSSELDEDLESLILEKTEGVPFFIEELIKSFRDLEFIQKKNNKFQLSKKLKSPVVPSTIQDVIMARIDPLPQGAKDVLQIGAVIEREFGYDLIKQASGMSEQQLRSHLSALRDSELVYERGVYPELKFVFKHALTREVVYDSIVTWKKQKLHARIGSALEKLYPTRLEEFYERLAYHYSASENLNKAYPYLLSSAERALSIYAYREAVRFFEKALEIQERLDPAGKAERCDLLLTLGESLLLAGEPRRFLDVEAPAGLALAEAIGDKARASRICYHAIEALGYYGGGTGYYTQEAEEWAKRADTYADPDTVERARADMAMGVAHYGAGRPGIGITFLDRALDLARRLDSISTFWGVASYWIRYVNAPHHHQERLALVRELDRTPRTSINAGMLQADLSRLCYTYLALGLRPEAERVANEVRILAERTKQAHASILSMFLDAIFLHMDGRLEDALEMSQLIARQADDRGLSAFGLVHAGVAGLRPRLHLGMEMAEIALKGFLESPAGPPNKVFCLAHLARHDEAREGLDKLVMQRVGFGTVEDETSTWDDGVLLEAAILVNHAEAVERLSNRLAACQSCTTSPYYTTCIARHLGSAALLLGRPAESLAYYQAALETAGKMKFRPEIALAHLEMAELLLKHYPEDRPEAEAHLNFAVTEFRDMKMRPALERALQYDDLLKTSSYSPKQGPDRNHAA